MRVSTFSFRRWMPCSAWIDRRRPSKANGRVTTPIVRAPRPFATSAMTGAAPVPVPPPLPAVMKTMSAPFRTSSISSRCSSAAARPTSGSLPAPRPRVSWRPMSSLMSASLIEQRLRVGVHGDELDALQPGVDHPVDGVHPGATDADDLDDGDEALRCAGHACSILSCGPGERSWSMGTRLQEAVADLLLFQDDAPRCPAPAESLLGRRLCPSAGLPHVPGSDPGSSAAGACGHVMRGACKGQDGRGRHSQVDRRASGRPARGRARWRARRTSAGATGCCRRPRGRRRRAAARRRPWPGPRRRRPWRRARPAWRRRRRATGRAPPAPASRARPGRPAGRRGDERQIGRPGRRRGEHPAGGVELQVAAARAGRDGHRNPLDQRDGDRRGPGDVHLGGLHPGQAVEPLRRAHRCSRR